MGSAGCILGMNLEEGDFRPDLQGLDAFFRGVGTMNLCLKA